MSPRADASAADAALTVAAAAHPPTATADAESAAIRFSVVILLACLVLQRFALPFGELALSIVAPLGLALAVYGLWTGALVLDERRVTAYLALAAAGFLGTMVGVALAITRLPEPSWTSLGQFLLLYFFGTVAFREKVDERRFFLAVSRCFLFIAAAGIVQFIAQFGGISIFTFQGVLPAGILYPPLAWHEAYPMSGTSLHKANGFFLVEPSVYSQCMGIALAIEIIYFRRLIPMALFSLGLILSVSGTGWIVLSGFVVGAVVRMGMRGIAIGVGTILTGLVALGVMSFALPDLFDILLSRVDEFSSPGSSGHERFITPWWALADAINWAPWTPFVGLGAGAAERLQTAYRYGMSTPVKVLIEYGLPALAAYLALFLAAERTRGQAALLPAALVWFLFTGTYVQFPPIVFAVLLLTSVARLRPSSEDAARSPPAS